MDNQTTVQQPQTPTSQAPKHSMVFLLLTLLALIVIIGAGFGVYTWQHNKVGNANNKVSNLQTQVLSLQSQVNKLNKQLSASTTTTPKKTTIPTTQATTTYSTLSPATVPSKVATCTQTLTTDNDGTVGPLSCSNGDLNTTAWQYIANNYLPKPPSVMALGYNDTCQQVLNAIDSDGSKGAMKQPEADAYTISALYYGWDFSTDPATAWINQETSC